MNPVFEFVIIPLITGLFGFILSKLITKREAKKDDLDTINKNVKPLLDAQQSILEQNQQLIERLSALETSKMNVQSKNAELKTQVNRLTKQLKELELKLTQFQEILKKMPNYETSN